MQCVAADGLGDGHGDGDGGRGAAVVNTRSVAMRAMESASSVESDCQETGWDGTVGREEECGECNQASGAQALSVFRAGDIDI